jgi:hypothetical protein
MSSGHFFHPLFVKDDALFKPLPYISLGFYNGLCHDHKLFDIPPIER